MGGRQKKWTQYTQSTKFFQGFFFHKVTINISTYLDMLQLYAEPQTEHLKQHFLLQQDRALTLIGVYQFGCNCMRNLWQDGLAEKAHSLGLLVVWT
jgi:hypothetical protein